MWKQQTTPKAIDEMMAHCMPGHIGIEMTEIGEDYIIAKMPVDQRTKQPVGLLHGGASAALAETIGSMASVLCLEDMTKQGIAGTELNISHLRSATKGYVYAKCTPVRIGRKIHVWDIRISDDNGKAIAISRLSTMVIQAS